LFSLWVAGRLGVMFSGVIGGLAAAGIDLLFLAALGATVAREIIAGKNTRNLKVLAVLAILFAGNAVSHAELLLPLQSDHGARVGLAAILMLIMLIGGRIIPSFTRNWLVRQGPGRLPQPFGRFDVTALVLAGAALGLWLVMPTAHVTAAAAAVAAASQFWRLSRWAGERTASEPLVLILHAAYAFVPIGFALLALSMLRPDAILESSAMHAWTAGAIGTMTLAVMTRASLGHTGRPLTATRAIRAIYAAVIVAALARIAAGLGAARDPLLHVAAAAWICAFAGFAAAFAPQLATRRPAPA
jgi:uncharacterized protein involved in response to NO